MTSLLALSTQASHASISAGTTSIRSGDALTLRGAQVHGHAISVKAQSLQVTLEKYNASF